MRLTGGDQRRRRLSRILGVGKATVKTHRGLFAKTGAERQADLITLLANCDSVPKP